MRFVALRAHHFYGIVLRLKSQFGGLVSNSSHENLPRERFPKLPSQDGACALIECKVSNASMMTNPVNRRPGAELEGRLKARRGIPADWELHYQPVLTLKLLVRITALFLQSYHPLSESSLSRKMEGYAKLSSVMSTDSEFAIYRKFGALNAQNLLYYQAQLLGLEDDLNDIASKDRSSQDSEKREFGYNWAELSQAADGKGLQLEKFMKLRKTLKEYSQHFTTHHIFECQC